MATILHRPGAGEVHVWQAPLDIARADLDRLSAHLSGAEAEHAAAAHHTQLRSRRIAARGWLRELLAGYAGVDPAQLTFVQGERGKPRLGGEPGAAFCFNLSHAEGIAVYAVTRGREVGIDIERVRVDVPDEVVRRYFSEQERRSLDALPAGERPLAFYERWTRKEAYLKARGIGLGGLAGCDADDPGWTVRRVDVLPGYVATVVVAGDAVVPRTAAPLALRGAAHAT